MREDTEHFEGHGNHWDAIGDLCGSNGLATIMQTSLDEGNVFKTALNPIVFVGYPTGNPIQSCVILYVNKDNESLEVQSMYPFMEGTPTKLTITDKYTWENGIEGEILGEFCDRIEIPFFAPFYYSQFLNIEIGKEYEIFLAGLAYSIENDSGRTFEFDSGAIYEMQLKEFLEKNPNKAKEDFPKVTASMAGCGMFFPQEYFAEISYRGPILSLTEAELFGVKIFKTEIRVAKGISSNSGENSDLIISLYIPENLLNGYNPKIGDDIQGVMWLTGYLKIQKNEI
jgi:hypothetical protein